MTASVALSTTPPPPYYAVIFSSIRRPREGDGYADMAGRMDALAARQPGFLGMESAHNEIGITVSYWDSLKAIAAWKRNIEHQAAQKRGREEWYSAYRLRICKVEKAYGF